MWVPKNTISYLLLINDTNMTTILTNSELVILGEVSIEDKEKLYQRTEKKKNCDGM